MTGYHKRYVKKTFPTIADWDLIDNDVESENTAYPKMVKVTSPEFTKADASMVSMFVGSQEEVITTILKREAALLKMSELSETANRMFNLLCDTTYHCDEE